MAVVVERVRPSLVSRESSWPGVTCKTVLSEIVKVWDAVWWGG